MIEWVKRWLASCVVDRVSLVGKLEGPNARRSRNLHAFCFCVLSVDRAQQEGKEEAENRVRKSCENRIKIEEKTHEN